VPHILGVLPARGGSEGIPGKNIRLLCGRPLLSWAAHALTHAPSVARAICSTDDDDIADAALACGLEVPFRRPAELANNTAPVVDVIRHAVDRLDDPIRPYTHVALVQATTPTVTELDIEAAIDIIRNRDADTVISGFPAGIHHPAMMYTLNKEGTVSWLFEKYKNLYRRQDFPPVLVRTGLVYIASVSVIRERGSLYGDHIHALIIDEQRAITIDEEHDFLRAQQIMESINCDRSKR
jgi:CMP-N-acetylneuraminic acid synthetase